MTLTVGAAANRESDRHFVLPFDFLEPRLVGWRVGQGYITMTTSMVRDIVLVFHGVTYQIV